MLSIIQKSKECFICKKNQMLESHHIFGGISNRKLSEKHGLKVWLCHECHEKVTRIDYSLNIELKKIAQSHFEMTKTREEFMKIFGKNYL